MNDDFEPGRLPNAGQDLIDAIAQAVASKLEQINGSQQRLMDIHEAAKYLGMSVNAVRHKAGVEVPCVRLDGKLRFDRRELDRIVNQAKRKGI